jgi:thiol-disulfide isomerase/thioredoxin
MTEHREGPLHPTEPDISYVMERKTVFLMADLASTSSPDQTFTLKPPLTATLVEKFEDRMEASLRQFVGKQAPNVSLKDADGKVVALKSLQGKPVLLDFWATWSVPCVESLPTLEKLYHESVKNRQILLSIDQDEDPNNAHEFWSKHNEPWRNFHANAEVLGHYPDHGIPYFVPIDASGQVVFSAAGLDETALRAAIVKLDPEFAQNPGAIAVHNSRWHQLSVPGFCASRLAIPCPARSSL